MIADVPTPQDFFDSGIELFDFAWDTVAQLITDLADAKEHFGVDKAEVSDEYWAASKRRLTTALAVAHQGVEFILKGKIAEVSPYLLIAESPSRWPSPYDGHSLTFAEFKTVDAQDLTRLHDIVAGSRLPDEFVTKFSYLRTKRNAISHSIDKRLHVHTTEVIETILCLHKTLFPDQNWAAVRANFLEKYPDVALGSEFARNRACRELEVLFGLLSASDIKLFFDVDTKQRLYLCPDCIEVARNHQQFDHKLAVLRTKGPDATCLYCPICDKAYVVARRDCDQSKLSGECHMGGCGAPMSHVWRMARDGLIPTALPRNYLHSDRWNAWTSSTPVRAN
jgi:hypothetical protein